MKKTKLLIPALSIASVGVIITPIITSCGNGMVMVDATKEFKPTIKQYIPSGEEVGGVTEEEATNIYFKGISKNHEIFRQDFMYAHTLTNTPGLTKFEIGMKIDNITTDGQLNGEIVFIQKRKTSEDPIVDNDFTLHATFVNCRLDVNPGLIEGISRAYIGIADFEEIGGWADDQKIILKAKGHTISNKKTSNNELFTFTEKEYVADKNFDYEGSEPEKRILYDTLLEFCDEDYKSYYLANIKINQENSR